MIKHVFIDLDNTLFDFTRGEQHALSLTLQKYGIEPTKERLEHYSRVNVATWEKLETGELTQAQVKEERFRVFYAEEGIRGVSPLESTLYYETLLCDEQYFEPGAEELLEALHPQYKIYIASNGAPEVQHSRIEKSGIESYLSGLYISEEMGAAKPSKAYFDLCFQQIPGFLAKEAVIVGDSLTSDISGGINAGMTTIWYNPKRALRNRPALPDYEIHHLMELPALLEKLNQEKP